MSTDGLAVVVMAKLPQAGRVKTRLMPELSAEEAAGVQSIFLRHVVGRLAELGELVVAFDPPDAGAAMGRELAGAARGPFTMMPQVSGDLGTRMATIARGVLESHQRVLFLGVDSPDVPWAYLEGAVELTANHDVTIGPCDDGGYWCLGLNRRANAAELLSEIEWSSGRELAQTLARAAARGYTTVLAPTWNDVDWPEDLGALLTRLARPAAGESATTLRERPDRLDGVSATALDVSRSEDFARPSPEVLGEGARAHAIVPRLRDELRALLPKRTRVRLRCVASPLLCEALSRPALLKEPRTMTEPNVTPLPNNESFLPQSTVLIVDDNPQNVELLQAFLESLPVKLITAADGVEALQRVKEHNPDLILLDVMMPRMSGFQVCKRLKSDPATRDIQILMVTALNELGDIEQATECGTDDFVSKPVNKFELLTRVKSLLRVRHLKNELERALTYLNEIEQEEDGDIPNGT